MIIDGVRLIVTSANFTTSDVHGDFANPDTRGNTNNLLKINNPELARLFTEEFNLMWGDGSGGKKDSLFGVHKPVRQPRTVNLGKTTVTVHFSPTPATLDWSESSNGLIGKTLENANKSVDLALFVFSEQKLANILEERHQKGVEVRTLIDPEFAFRSYSEGLDMLGVTLTNKCRIEKDNNPWKSPIKTVGIPQLPQGDKLHHKFGLIDRETVITGSHNWSASANYTNDETLLVINSSIVGAHFNREFERLYSDAVLGLPEKVSNKIQEDTERCPQITGKSPSDSRSKLVNINTATQEELETLPGVGAKLAQRIIEARQEKPFTSLEDLERVRGIKKSKLKKLEGNVSW
jgi:competence ComEA-like helix-hairpin-helix protein